MRDAHGEDSYRRFVVELLGPCQARGRLRWWQEQMLEPVRTALGLDEFQFADVTTMFRHCPVHGSELQEESVPIAYGTRKPAPKDELDIASRLFPFAHERAYGPCWVEKATHRRVYFCPGCRDALHAWRNQRKSGETLCAELDAMSEDDSRVNLLIELLGRTGHERHEDIVFDLGLIGAPAAVDAILKAAREPVAYLKEWGNLHEFQRKCAYALARIGTASSRDALEHLAKADDTHLREFGQEGLEHWPLPFKTR